MPGVGYAKNSKFDRIKGKWKWKKKKQFTQSSQKNVWMFLNLKEKKKMGT